MDVTQEALYQVWRRPTPYYLSDEADVAQIQAAVSWAYTQGDHERHLRHHPLPRPDHQPGPGGRDAHAL